MKTRNPPKGASYSEDFLNSRNGPPQVSALMAQGVSSFRKERMASEVAHGIYREGTGPSFVEEGLTSLANATSSVGFNRTAQVAGGGGYGGGMGAMGGTVKQIPEVYSPLWLTSNLNLPRDRATINAWCRAFYALNPFVQNAIQLHSTYPISKLSIKCPNPKIQKFFDDMIEELDLMNICVQIAQEFWLLGEAFIYAELDSNKGKWSRLMIYNPDYMIVKRTVIASEPLIMLRPDENLKRVVSSNRPADIEQRKQLNQHIVNSVKRGENIQLDNFSCTHLARKISPYEIRGTGLPVCIFRQLMLFDSLRECFSEDTEVLTDQGFKTIDQITHLSTDINQNPNFVNGIALDENNSPTSVLTLNDDIKVACFNAENDQLEYHQPIELHMSHYTGKMIHFESRNFDTLVSPNHKMLVQKANRIDGVRGWSEWQKIKACDINPGTTYRFRGVADWSGENRDYVQVLDRQIPIKLYLKTLGYIISEGYLGQNCIDLCQKVTSDCAKDIRDTVLAFADQFNLKVAERERATKDYKAAGFQKQPANRWNGRIYSTGLMNHFIDEITDGFGKSTAEFKKIPKWVKSLNKELLSILLESMVAGDGSTLDNKCSKAYKYFTSSRQLADDVQEIVFKCGFAPSISQRYRGEVGKPRETEYIVSWSDAMDGNFPNVLPNNKYPPKIQEADYEGVVWCFEVPTGYFITRRNGKLAIHGNSKYVQASSMVNPITLIKVGNDGPDGLHPTHADLESWRQLFEAAENDKNFKIITHPGVTVERVGFGQGIYDISGDITQLIKEIFIGLQTPPVVMDGTDITYNNGGVALDVLRQRYMQFRNMMSAFLRRKIFAPISRIQGFYDVVDGKKQLIVPDIDWNHMSLFDAGDYITNLVNLTASSGPSGPPPRASLHTLYRSLGLEWEDEQRKLRKEAIAAEILKKEQVALTALPLTELRALDEDEDIPEPVAQPGQAAAGEAPVPGEVPSGGGGAMPPMPADLGSLPGLGAPPPPSGPGPAPEAPPPPPAAGTPPPK
jgi:hypothetical protein